MKYDEYIKKLNPKPRFILDWYNDKDFYSDGDIEDLIIDLLANNEPDNYTHAIAANHCWPVYYHLSHVRKNILNWYPFSEDSSVLEIGCGFGAITSVLCDNCKKVTAVELSKRRAAGALLRCREKENLKIIVGNLNDIEFKEKFDYITLIGVLEYQGSYTNSQNPYQDFLKKIKNLLKPSGKLLIAIENQYGLKYWCGAKEDHTGVPFEGMNGYIFSQDKGVRTFSKSSLDRLIHQSGFSNTFFYYPMPDYKLPMVIFSQNELPKNGNMYGISYYYTDTSSMVAYEKNIYEDIVENGAFEFFSNSFLVECSIDEEASLGEIPFAIASCLRQREYCVGTRFTNIGTVEKYSLFPEGVNHINSVYSYEQALLEQGIPVIQSQISNSVLVTPKIDLPNLFDVCIDLIKAEDKEAIIQILDTVYEHILASSDEVSGDLNILYTMNLGIVPDNSKYGKILKNGYIDMILKNALMDDNGDFYWFDQEWILENVPAGYVMFRVLRDLYLSYEKMVSLIPIETMSDRYNITEPWNDYMQLENLFMNTVLDYTYRDIAESFCNASTDIGVNAINSLLALR